MSPGKKELKWQRAELCEAKLIVKMGDQLARNAANDFLVACRLFDARWRRWERDERRKPPPSGLAQLEAVYQIDQKYMKAQLDFGRAQGRPWRPRIMRSMCRACVCARNRAPATCHAPPPNCRGCQVVSAALLGRTFEFWHDLGWV